MSKKEQKALEDAEFEALMGGLAVETKPEEAKKATESNAAAAGGDGNAKNKKKKEKAKAKKEAEEKAR